MQPIWKALFSVAVLTLGAISAFGQPVISAKSGVVSYVMGKVTVGDQVVEPSETKLAEIKENAVLRTEEGRAEVLLTLGTILRTGENASFRMITNRLIDTRLELLSGSHIVEVAEVSKDNNLTVLAKDATVVVNKKGLYRFDVERSQIKVYEGSLGVQVNGQNVVVGAGKMVPMSGVNGATAAVEKFDREETDTLDHWAKRRAERLALANASSAKQVHDYGCAPNSFSAVNNPSTTSPCYNPCNSWRYNPWYGVVTYIPCGNNISSPYGYRYWSPYNVMRAYYRPPAQIYNPNSGGGFGGGGVGSYSGMPQTSGGYSGAMSAPASSVSASPAAAANSGSTASSSAATSSGGHGAAGGHGR